MKRILIIQTAFIGDAVLAAAMLEKVHLSHPDWKIDFLVRKGNEGLFAEHPFLNRLIIWDKKENKYLHLLQLLFKIRSKKYDIVVNAQRYAATGFLTGFSGAREKIGFDKNPLSFLFSNKVKHDTLVEGTYLHEVERNQRLIASFTDGQYAMPRLYPSAADEKEVKVLKGKPYICVAPASVWKTKQYPKFKWREFLDAISEDYVVYLIGAPSDKELCERISSKSSHKMIFNLAGKLSFLQSAALMKDAKMNYANDSAPMHFASAMNAPITAVYCSTVPEFGYGPLGKNSTIIEADIKLSCKPCGTHGSNRCPEKHYDCAIKIKKEQLLATLPSII